MGERTDEFRRQPSNNLATVPPGSGVPSTDWRGGRQLLDRLPDALHDTTPSLPSVPSSRRVCFQLHHSEARGCAHLEIGRLLSLSSNIYRGDNRHRQASCWRAPARQLPCLPRHENSPHKRAALRQPQWFQSILRRCSLSACASLDFLSLYPQHVFLCLAQISFRRTIRSAS